VMTTPGIFGWIRPTLSTPDTVFLQRCGLDAYFFLRFLQTLLKMFIPLAFVVLPILLTLNLACGNSGVSKVRGLDKLSWANFGMTHSNYYWAYLILALSTIVHFCYTIYQEFCEYVRIRQEYLVSSLHCHQVSATTVFLAGIPNSLLSSERLSDLYKDLFDGVQDVWINQDCSRLLSKVRQRDKIVALLEAAETKLIAKAVKAHEKLCYNASGSEKSPPTRLYSESSVPVWKQYLRDEDRACVRLPICGLAWVPGLPFIGRKVDVIEHCRQQLARLNTEIETDQLNPKKHPLLNSAFIRFHSQKAAHLACRATAYCSPHKLVPQFVDVSPEDVIWESLLVRWWGDYARRYLIIVFIVVIIMGWSIPIAFTGLLSQISYLVPLFPWLHGLERMPKWLLGFVQGLLPQAILMVLTMLLPITVRLLAEQQGFSTGMFIELAVQRYYFSLLFLQVFLTVSLSSSATTILGDIFDRPGSIPSMLATNIPKTSNYFYSYMLLQAFSISANALIQVARLMKWVFLTSLMDRTPRQKWKRKANVPEMQWGTIYPVYTNLACIGMLDK